MGNRAHSNWIAFCRNMAGNSISRSEGAAEKLGDSFGAHPEILGSAHPKFYIFFQISFLFFFIKRIKKSTETQFFFYFPSLLNGNKEMQATTRDKYKKKCKQKRTNIGKKHLARIHTSPHQFIIFVNLYCTSYTYEQTAESMYIQSYKHWLDSVKSPSFSIRFGCRVSVYTHPVLCNHRINTIRNSNIVHCCNAAIFTIDISMFRVVYRLLLFAC